MNEFKNTALGWSPRVPRHWEIVPLRYVAKLGTGHTPDRNKPEYWTDCTIPWVTTTDVTRRAGSLQPLLETEQHISELGLRNSAAVLHPADTVMLSRTASVGYSVRIGRPMATTQAFVTWTPGPRLDARYLLLVLRAMADEWKRLAYGSTHLTIYMPDLESLRIPLPPLEEQRRIADFLDAESARMGSLRVALTRFKQSLDERKASLLAGTVSASVNRPGDRLPDDWRWVPLMHLTDQARPVMYGIVLPGPNIEDGVPIVKGGDVVANRLQPHLLSRTARDIESSYVRSRLRANDLLIAIRGSVGEVAVVPPELEGGNLTQDAARISIGKHVDGGWLHLALESPIVVAQIHARVTGATIKGINIWDLKRVMIPCPTGRDQAALRRFVDAELATHKALYERVERHMGLVAERRQTLITAAVTGQIDVTTARGVEV